MWILKRIKANFMEMIKKRKRVRLFTSLNILYSKLEKSISTIENYKPIIILALVYLLINKFGKLLLLTKHSGSLRIWNSRQINLQTSKTDKDFFELHEKSRFLILNLASFD